MCSQAMDRLLLGRGPRATGRYTTCYRAIYIKLPESWPLATEPCAICHRVVGNILTDLTPFVTGPLLHLITAVRHVLSCSGPFAIDTLTVCSRGCASVPLHIFLPHYGTCATGPWVMCNMVVGLILPGFSPFTKGPLTHLLQGHRSCATGPWTKC